MKTLHMPTGPKQDEPKTERTLSGRLVVGNVIHLGTEKQNDTIVMKSPPGELPTTTLKMQKAPPLPAPPTEDQSGIKPRFDKRTATGTVVIKNAPSVPAPAAHVEPAPAVPGKKPLLDAMKLNKAVVSSYKFMGFAILGTILLGLASFIFTNLFYLLNRSWATPLVLSPSDPRVLQIDAQLSAEKAARDGAATQRLQLQAQLADARRIQKSEEDFQAAFQGAMSAEATDRGQELAQLQHLLGDLQRTRSDVAQTSQDYSAMSKEQLKDEYAAGLIGKDEATRGGLELSQIAGANVALHEKHVEIDARVTELQRAVSSLKNGKSAASYEVLHMRHEFDQSVLASKKAAGDAEALEKSIAMVDGTIAGYDAQIARIARAPYVMAADRSVSTAFVPYDNAGAAKVGDGVFACALGPLLCHRVGQVAEVLDGEVVEKHPLHNRELRGVLVRLALDDAAAVQHPVLHLGRKPLAF
jgi:hypothetical protein